MENIQSRLTCYFYDNDIERLVLCIYHLLFMWVEVMRSTSFSISNSLKNGDKGCQARSGATRRRYSQQLKKYGIFREDFFVVIFFINL